MGMVFMPPRSKTGTSKSANVLLSSAKILYEAFQLGYSPTECLIFCS